MGDYQKMKKLPNNSLVMITNEYPYGNKEHFVETELPFLLEKFSRVIIIPLRVSGAIRKVPDRVPVIDSLGIKNVKGGKFECLRKVLVTFSKKYIYKELFKRPQVIFKWKHFRYLLGYVNYMVEGCSLVRDLIQSNPELKEAVFYSYWLHAHASILALLKRREFPNLKVVSRAHAYDIYEEDFDPPFIPFRQETLAEMSKIFAISNNGRNYLLQNTSANLAQVAVCRLGVPGQNFQVKSSNQSSFSIVSCSFLASYKRVHKIIEGIAYLAKQNPEVEFHWNHLGGGELFDELYELAQRSLPCNVNWKILGDVSNEEVFQFYQSHPIDVFLSTSGAEGVPVAMMEAAASGIPIVATDVGGVSEIVNADNGILLASDPSDIEIAEALQQLVTDRKVVDTMKSGSKKHWMTHFDQERNYPIFANKLIEV